MDTAVLDASSRIFKPTVKSRSLSFAWGAPPETPPRAAPGGIRSTSNTGRARYTCGQAEKVSESRQLSGCRYRGTGHAARAAPSHGTVHFHPESCSGKESLTAAFDTVSSGRSS